MVKNMLRLALALVLVSTGRLAFAQAVSDLPLPSLANLYGSGHPFNLTPTPGGGGGGIAPVGISLAPGTSRVLTFGAVTGTVSLTGGITTSADGLSISDGTAPYGIPMQINAYNGLSGIKLTNGSGFLAGVFLTDLEPADPPPASLTFTNNGTLGEIPTSFTEFSPLVHQIFFIGDGLTGNGSGAVQKFNVPDSATRLFLGFTDGHNYVGDPGQYHDNTLGLTASFTIAAVPEPSAALVMAAASVLLLRRRSR